MKDYYIDEVLWSKAEQTYYLVKVTCIYLCCRWRSNYQGEQFGIPLTGLIPSHCVVPFPYQNMDHQTSCLSIFKSWCERCVFVLLILMAFFTSIFVSFHCYYIGILSFFFRNCTENWFKTWKHTSFVIFCYCYRWHKVTSLLVFHENILSHVSKVNFHVHAVFFKTIKKVCSLLLYF